MSYTELGHLLVSDGWGPNEADSEALGSRPPEIKAVDLLAALLDELMGLRRDAKAVSAEIRKLQRCVEAMPPPQTITVPVATPYERPGPVASYEDRSSRYPRDLTEKYTCRLRDLPESELLMMMNLGVVLTVQVRREVSRRKHEEG
jgi:hypothetical protein